MKVTEERSITQLREAVEELSRAVATVRDQHAAWQPPMASVALPSEARGWNFTTFEKYINQRFGDLSLQLRERYEAQQTGVTAALAAAEKAVNAALTAAEKAVDKAERAQQLRNEAQNEFRKALGDLSGLMWTIKEGQAAVDGVRREISITVDGTVNRVTSIENAYSNLQGRMWAISALWAVFVLSATIGVHFVGK